MNSFRIIIIALVTISMLACSNGRTQESENMQSSTDVSTIEQLFQKSMNGIEKIKYHESIDKKNGLVQARYPIPKSWKVNHTENAVYIEGPDNLQVYKSETNEFAWSNNPMMQQTLQMNGKRLVQPMNNQQVLNQFIKPNAEAQGYKFLKSYDLQEVAGLWQRLYSAMPNTGTRRDVEVMGTEWETGKGTKAMIMLVRSQFTNQQTVLWNLQTTELEVKPDYFEEAKNAYFYSSANAQLNPEWIQQMNGQLAGNIRQTKEFWAKASAESAAAHQQRMNAIAARGNAAKSIGDTYSDILDISHQGYLNRSNINDAGHAKTIRSINETSLIGNHETGEHYTVPSGSRYYWVANDGTYLGTDNALLNPNIDNRMNDKDWTKFAVE
ncbi:MAG: hypothetical protein KDD63_17945 [Bacteroidetes bacterium]|nr:hypothetical protein [Bacteroidota bacterium]